MSVLFKILACKKSVVTLNQSHYFIVSKQIRKKHVVHIIV